MAKIYEGIDPEGVYLIAEDQDCDHPVVKITVNGNNVSVPAMSVRLVKK